MIRFFKSVSSPQCEAIKSYDASKIKFIPAKGEQCIIDHTIYKVVSVFHHMETGEINIYVQPE